MLLQLDFLLLRVLVNKLHAQPPEEAIEDTVAFIKDVAEATQQASTIGIKFLYANGASIP